MGTVFLAQLPGPSGFEKWAAIKWIHPHLSKDARFISMFLDEARLAAQVQHVNVCQVVDLVADSGRCWLVMEYLHGESFAAVIGRAVRREGNLPVPIAVRIVIDAARGLHAAHVAVGKDGAPLGVVHRDATLGRDRGDASGGRRRDRGRRGAQSRRAHRGPRALRACARAATSGGRGRCGGASADRGPASRSARRASARSAARAASHARAPRVRARHAARRERCVRDPHDALARGASVRSVAPDPERAGCARAACRRAVTATAIVAPAATSHHVIRGSKSTSRGRMWMPAATTTNVGEIRPSASSAIGIAIPNDDASTNATRCRGPA